MKYYFSLARSVYCCAQYSLQAQQKQKETKSHVRFMLLDERLIPRFYFRLLEVCLCNRERQVSVCELRAQRFFEQRWRGVVSRDVARGERAAGSSFL